jgi:hypothetical protein
VAAKIALAVLVLVGVAIGVAWGLGALLVYLFLAGVAGAISYGAGAGGEWLSGASRGRFHRDPRRRS